TDVAKSRGLNHVRLDEANLTVHANDWDFSLGRMTEPMGVTGYYFGKEYDGGRAVWTGAHTQVRLGYGDFRHSTGVTDSAYTHATRQSFVRGVTKEEWLGYKATAINSRTTDAVPYYPNYSTLIKDTPGFDGLYQRLVKAQSLAEQKQILDEYLNVVKQDNPKAYQKLMDRLSEKGKIQHDDFAWYKVTVRDKHGNVVGTYLSQEESPQLKKLHPRASLSYQDRFNREKMEDVTRKAWESAEANLETTRTRVEKLDNIDGHPDGVYNLTYEFYGYGTYHGKKPILGYNLKMSDLQPGDFRSMTKDEAKERTIRSSWDKSAYHGVQSLKRNPDDPDSGFTLNGKIPAGNKRGISHLGQTIIDYLIDDYYWGPEDKSALPLNLLKRAGYFVLQVGTILERDQIPALKQAFYVQARHELSPNLGVAAWYLRSVGNDSHRFLAANGTGNDVSTFDTLANVVGVGAKWQLSKNAALSFDYGVNTTDFGKYMNGHTRYEHKSGTSDFAIRGRETGSAPRFWVMRLDLGKADTKVPHSWNAFIDYKRFEHGSFFGGNGTEALPDRYLDGIKSFTVGAGYVPMENLLVEAFYTFGAKGIGARDTLYGPERFSLGDYARVQLTYRF
ncbi:MAG: TonB-dependent receptor, partial [Selenomonas sp.]